MDCALTICTVKVGAQFGSHLDHYWQQLVVYPRTVEWIPTHTGNGS